MADDRMTQFGVQETTRGRGAGLLFAGRCELGPFRLQRHDALDIAPL